MGYAKYVRASFAKSAKERSESYTLRLRKWRKQPVVNRADGPTNPVRARELGYKAAPGYVIARVRIRRGRHRRRQPDLGRKPGRNRKRVEPGRELKWYALNRAARRFANLTPLNAYWVGEDGVYKYFEIILRDDHDSEPSAYRAAKKAELKKLKTVSLKPPGQKKMSAEKKASTKKAKPREKPAASTQKAADTKTEEKAS